MMHLNNVLLCLVGTAVYILVRSDPKMEITNRFNIAKVVKPTFSRFQFENLTHKHLPLFNSGLLNFDTILIFSPFLKKSN